MLPRRLQLVLLLCLSAPFWTACAPLPPAVQVERLTVPTSLLTCAVAPPPPGDPVTDADLARWILDLSAAGDDCRGRLARVRDMVVGELAL